MIEKTNAIVLLTVLICAFMAPAADGEQEQADNEAAAAFLDEAIKKYALPMNKGVKSFELLLKFRGGENPDLEWITETVTVSYAWTAPAEERIEVVGVPEAFHGLLRDPLRDLWKDIAAGCVFAGLEDKLLSVEGSDEEITLTIAEKPQEEAAPSVGVPHRIVFEPATHLVLRAETTWEGGSSVVEPTYDVDQDGLLRLASKRVVVETGEQGRSRLEVAHAYGAHRHSGPNALPTTLTLEVDDKRFTYNIAYLRLNGRAAVLDAADPEKVKALVKEFEKDYSRMGATEKQRYFKELEETGHEMAALSIAKKGLKDKDLAIRALAARTVGAMRCRKALSSLTRALKPNARNTDVYLALIKALGDLGDPKAIPHLSKDFWNQKDAAAGIRAAQAKITALGYIRSKKAVDALIDMLYVADPLAMMAVAGHMQASLKRLTGEDFGMNRDAWRGWWKKNERKFKLEED